MDEFIVLAIPPIIANFDCEHVRLLRGPRKGDGAPLDPVALAVQSDHALAPCDRVDVDHCAAVHWLYCGRWREWRCHGRGRCGRCGQCRSRNSGSEGHWSSSTVGAAGRLGWRSAVLAEPFVLIWYLGQGGCQAPDVEHA